MNLARWCCGAFIRCQIDTKFGEHSYFIWMDLTPKPYAQIHIGTLTSEIKARGRTQRFNKPIFGTLSTHCPYLAYALSSL